MTTKAETPREVYTILLLGDQRAGKTHFFNELNETPNYNKHSSFMMPTTYVTTTNMDLCRFNYNIRGRNFHINLWDTPGSSAYHQLIARFMTQSFNMIIIMFTADKIANVSYWIEFINNQHLSYTPTVVLIENGLVLNNHKYSQYQSPDTLIAKYPYLKYSINLSGQSSYILKNIIEEAIMNTPHMTHLCCNDRKNNRCCF